MTVGFAVTEPPVEDDNPVEGDQLNVKAPPAVKFIPGEPWHFDDTAGLTVTIGEGFTVTVFKPERSAAVDEQFASTNEVIV